MKFAPFLLAAALLFSEEEEVEELLPPEIVFTQHSIELESGPFHYTAATALCPIVRNEKKVGEIFCVSYIKEIEDDTRPITFIFPGGPGGSATWQAILNYGPRRLLTADEGRTILPPYKIIDNPQTLLPLTDLVFVDPIDCGFSRSSPDVDPSIFYSIDGDLRTLAEFIHTFIATAKRWNSPIYLAGSSYGTLRCTGLVSRLLGTIASGIILDGCAFNWPTFSPERDSPLPDALIIPTFAATAWYHKRLWPEKPLVDVVEYARRFVYEDYLPYMLQPSRLSYVEKEAFQKNYALLTGLSIDVAKRYNCRLNETTYTAEFFGPERKAIGGLDTRFVGDVVTIDPQGAQDPSYKNSMGIIAAFNHYLQKELKTEFPYRKYISFSYPALSSWNFSTPEVEGLPNFLQRIRDTLTAHPLLKIYVGLGYYDCRTPFGAAEYSFEQLDLPISYKNNFQFEYYEAGHGLLFDYPSLKKQKEDLVKFYTR